MKELYEQAMDVIREVQKAIVGKNDVIENIMMAVIARGHVLIDDTPGVGKTTMALSFAKAMGIKEKRVQFTPDVMPTDLTGFTVYRKDLGKFVYQAGALACNLFLADELNRTSPKTQSALLEVMEERQLTVDGVTRKLEEPFLVLATQNPEGSAGTQLLPESQLDRFMICIHMGYPDLEEEVEILKRRHGGNPVGEVQKVITAEQIVAMQMQAEQIFMHDSIYEYIAKLAQATRKHEMLSMGMSPRGSVALAAMSRSSAWLQGRNYVIPMDVKRVFIHVASHRVYLSTKAKVGHVQTCDVLRQILADVEEPGLKRR